MQVISFDSKLFVQLPHFDSNPLLQVPPFDGNLISKGVVQKVYYQMKLLALDGSYQKGGLVLQNEGVVLKGYYQKKGLVLREGFKTRPGDLVMPDPIG